MFHLLFLTPGVSFCAGCLAHPLACPQLQKRPDDGGTRMIIVPLLSRRVALSLRIKPLRMHPW